MAQVPYNPVPQETLSKDSLPQYRVDIPDAAFGTGIASALGHLGKTVEGAGNELWARAVAMQQLNNEAEAREADTEYMIKAGELRAAYSTLQGKAAVDAYPKYAEDLKNERDIIKGRLSNPHVRKLYDAQTLSTMGRSIFNGAGHAATENKQFVIATARSQLELDAKEVEDRPGDPALFEDKLSRVRANAAELAGMEFGVGLDSPITQNLIKKAESKLRSQRIVGLSREQPGEAAKALDKEKAFLTADDFLRVDNTVRQAGRSVESVNIANRVFDEGKGFDAEPDATLAQMEAEVRRKAKEFNDKDPLLEQAAVAALRSRVNQERYAAREEKGANLEIVNEAIGLGVKNIQELRANPRVAAAIDALPAGVQNDLPGKINRYNAARDKQTNDETAQRLNGMRLSPETVADFIDLDITKEQLSKEDMLRFQGYQASLRKNVEGDPRVNRALQQLRAAMPTQLQALDVYSLKKGKNDDTYLKYVGALHSAIDVWTKANGKAPQYKDIVETIGPEVIKQVPVGGFLKWGDTPLWNSKQPRFQIDTSSKEFITFSEKLKADLVKKKAEEPTPEEIEKAFITTQFIQLYGQKKSSNKRQDRVP